jgi:hypothetical protein
MKKKTYSSQCRVHFFCYYYYRSVLNIVQKLIPLLLIESRPLHFQQSIK